ncbi:MAG: IS630 family transposase [Sulfurimonas sp.]|nr:IS630 family transposase [Sulfurimonas sp.]
MIVKYDIKETDRNLVTEAMRKEKNAVAKNRLLAVSLLLDGMKKKEIQKVLHRGKNYVGTWISAYFKDGVDGLKEKRGGDHKSYLSEEERNEFKSLITITQPVDYGYENKGWDGKIMVDLILKKYQQQYTTDAIYKLLQRLGITYKTASKVDPRKSQDKINIWKEDSRFSSESNRITSWSTKGMAVSYSGYPHGTSVNCLGSLNLVNSNLITSFHDRGNTETTIAHLKIVREYYGDTPLAYLIDNAPWHKTKLVKEFCEANNITLLFLPPYSPEFNPIERVWSFLKSKVRQKFFKTAGEFRNFVLGLLENINITEPDKLMRLCSSLV